MFDLELYVKVFSKNSNVKKKELLIQCVEWLFLVIFIDVKFGVKEFYGYSLKVEEFFDR